MWKRQTKQKNRVNERENPRLNTQKYVICIENSGILIPFDTHA